MLPPDSLPPSILSHDPDDEFTYTGGCYPADRPATTPDMDPLRSPYMDAVRHTELPRSHTVLTAVLHPDGNSPASAQWTQSNNRTVMSVIPSEDLDPDDWSSTFLTNGH